MCHTSNAIVPRTSIFNSKLELEKEAGNSIEGNAITKASTRLGKEGSINGGEEEESSNAECKNTFHPL